MMTYTQNKNFLSTTPQSTWQLIKTAVSIWKHTFLRVVIFSIVIQLLANLYLFINTKYIWLVSIINFIVIIAAHISIIYLVDQFVHNKRIDYRHIILCGSSKVLPFIAVTIIYCLLTCTGLLLFIIPGILGSIYLVFAGYLVIIEKDITIIGSIKRSYKLVKNNWWHISMVLSIIFLLLTTIIASIFMISICLWLGCMITDYPLHIVSLKNLLINEINKNFSQVHLIFQIIASIISIFATPLSHIIMLTVLYDLQIRNKEKIL